MAKVYCGECEHYRCPSEHLCEMEVITTHTPVRGYETYISCLVKNKDNNCSDFKVKRNWRGKPMWNQDWGRSRIPDCPNPPPPPNKGVKDSNVSDILFAAAKLGKPIFEELAQSVGKVDSRKSKRSTKCPTQSK